MGSEHLPESTAGFDRGNDAAREALAHGGDDPDDEASRFARAELTHARLALQLTPLEDLARWVGILDRSALPADRREALLRRLEDAEIRSRAVGAAVLAAAGIDDSAARSQLSDALGRALAQLDQGVGVDAPTRALCGALAAVRFDEGDEEALIADQVAEEQI